MSAPNRLDNSLQDAERQSVRNLVPLHTLSEDVFDGLLQQVTIQRHASGEVLFKQGDADQLSYYLLEGRVDLIASNRVVDNLVGGTEQARFPIANLTPRQHGARTASAALILRVDSRVVSDAMARCHQAEYQVDDLDEADDADWMSQLLRSPVLQQVPAANIQQVMMKVQQVDVRRGQRIVRQGDRGDYYYMLLRGRALVTRLEPGAQEPVELARLGPGDAFGEEALLSDQQRNSSISMLEDGLLLRLDKEHFCELIQKPLASALTLEQAKAKVAKGAVWLDLRSSGDFDEQHLPGSINLPQESLRYEIERLAPDRQYVVYSYALGSATVGAFLLAARGFDVALLSGGQLPLDKQPATAAVTPLASPKSDANEAPASQPEISSALQARVSEAEQRAQELERRLAQAEDAERERQHELDSFRQIVGQTEQQIRETEQARNEALAAQQQAQGEMEALTSNLENLQVERAQLADRMSEIEGLDKSLQRRLQKAERELIGERERAESATYSLEQLNLRMSESLQAREDERTQHALERGQLKEQITELRMELDLTAQEMQELREEQTAQEGAQQRVSEVERQRDELQSQYNEAAQELAELREQLELLQSQSAGLKSSAQEELAQNVQAYQQAVDQLQQEQAQAAQLSQQNEQLQKQLEQAQLEIKEAQDDNAELQKHLGLMHDQQRELSDYREFAVQQNVAMDLSLDQASQECARLAEHLAQLRSRLVVDAEEAG